MGRRGAPTGRVGSSAETITHRRPSHAIAALAADREDVEDRGGDVDHPLGHRGEQTPQRLTFGGRFVPEVSLGEKLIADMTGGQAPNQILTLLEAARGSDQN